MAEDVWDGRPPEGAASTLTSHVSLLRRLLGADRISNSAGTYTLRVEPGELDSANFESDVADGHAALDRGDPRKATACFERGLRRWRGPVLADVEAAPWAQGTIARLLELRLTAEESLLEARMALGRHHETVAAAQAAVEAEPLREQRWAILMLALYLLGAGGVEPPQPVTSDGRSNDLRSRRSNLDPTPGPGHRGAADHSERSKPRAFQLSLPVRPAGPPTCGRPLEVG